MKQFVPNLRIFRPMSGPFLSAAVVVATTILLIGTESGFAQSGVHRFGATTSQPNRSISLELLGAAPSAFLKYYDLYPLEASTNLVD